MLVVSVGVLLVAESLTFKQISLLKESADRVSHSLEVEMSINTLYSYYALMQAEELENQLDAVSVSDTSWEDQKEVTFTSFKILENLVKDNPMQLAKLKEIGQLQDSLYDALTALARSVPDSSQTMETRTRLVARITRNLESIREAKDDMLEEEHNLFTERKLLLDMRADRAPLFTLLLALFALSIFLLAFARIYRNKQRVKRSEEFLQSILSNTNNIVNYYEPVYDEQGTVTDFRIIFANECNKTYLGVDPDKIIGKRVTEVFSFLRLNGELDELRRSFNDQETVTLERQIAVHDKKVWFRTTIVPHADGILITGSNTTRERDDEEKLRDLNERLRNRNEELIRTEAFLEGVLRSTKNVIMSFEPLWDHAGSIEDFRLIFINQSIDGIVDPGAGELVGEKVSKISPFIYETELFGHMVHCYKKNTPVDFESSYTRDGVEYWVQGTAIKWHQIITVNLSDITKQVKAEKGLISRNLQLKRSNEELESFNRVASHDLQEPLRKIQLFISRFVEKENANFSDKGEEYLSKVSKAAERMQSLIVNLLAYSKIDKSHENFEDVNLNTTLGKVEEELALQIIEKKAKIEKASLPVIRGVPFQMEQLFANLISNALKYSNPRVPTRISVQVETIARRQIKEDFSKPSRKYHKITVADNGIGFNPENSGKIFEVFQRLHQKNEYSGTGIGLAICKKIVENHMGYIGATGDPGKGATFFVYLPVRE